MNANPTRAMLSLRRLPVNSRLEPVHQHPLDARVQRRCGNTTAPVRSSPLAAFAVGVPLSANAPRVGVAPLTRRCSRHVHMPGVLRRPTPENPGGRRRAVDTFASFSRRSWSADRVAVAPSAKLVATATATAISSIFATAPNHRPTASPCRGPGAAEPRCFCDERSPRRQKLFEKLRPRRRLFLPRCQTGRPGRRQASSVPVIRLAARSTFSRDRTGTSAWSSTPRPPNGLTPPLLCRLPAFAGLCCRGCGERDSVRRAAVAAKPPAVGPCFPGRNSRALLGGRRGVFICLLDLSIRVCYSLIFAVSPTGGCFRSRATGG